MWKFEHAIGSIANVYYPRLRWYKSHIHFLHQIRRATRAAESYNCSWSFETVQFETSSSIVTISVLASAGMGSEGPLNGGTSSMQQEASPAEQLLKKHAADESHRATIEDVVDEEDIAHPPPSALMQDSTNGPPSDSVLQPKSESLSAKAAGKQRAKEEPVSETGNAESAGVMIDTKSDEAFPSLGAGSKPRTAATVSSAWGAKKPASVAKAAANGLNKHGPELSTSSTTSSRASTPAPGVLTPSSVTASATPQSYPSRGPTPQILSIPGRHTERIQFAPSQLLPRQQLKKPVMDVLRDINKRSKATVEMRPGPGGVISFEGRGPTDAVRQALKDVAKELGSKVSDHTILAPKSVLTFQSKSSRSQYLHLFGHISLENKEQWCKAYHSGPVRGYNCHGRTNLPCVWKMTTAPPSM